MGEFHFGSGELQYQRQLERCGAEGQHRSVMGSMN